MTVGPIEGAVAKAAPAAGAPTTAIPSQARANGVDPTRASIPPAAPPTRRRRRRLPGWLLLPLVGLPVAARTMWPEPYPTISLPVLSCVDPAVGMLTIIIDDRSGSTYHTDPRRRRHPEMRQVIRWLDDADCHPDDAVAIAQFDDVLPPLAPLVLDTGVDTVLKTVSHDAPTSSSSLTSPTVQAARWAAEHLSMHSVALIATDGMLDDYDAAFAALNEFPGEVYVLALGGPLPPEWAAADVVRGVVELNGSAELGDVARSLATLLQSASSEREKGAR